MTPSQRCLAILASATLVASTAGCRRDSTPPPTPKPPTVVVAPVETRTLPVRMELAGTLESISAVELKPKVNGYIVSRDFTEGRKVEKGDELYQIDPRPFQATLDQVTAEHAAAQANQTFYASEMKRVNELAEQGASSENEVLKYQRDLADANASVARTEAQIEQARLNLEYARIEAPFTGVIQQTLVHVGDLARAESTVLSNLIAMDPIYVVFMVSRARLAEAQRLEEDGVIKPMLDNARVRIGLPDGSFDDQVGSVDLIGSRINPTTDSLMVRGVFKNPVRADGTYTLIPGQYVPVRFVLGSRSDELSIPSGAVIERQSGDMVYVLKADGTVTSRNVTLDPAVAGFRVVRDGLTAGEKVVVRGQNRLREGQTVTVLTTPPGETQPPGTEHPKSPDI